MAFLITSLSPDSLFGKNITPGKTTDSVQPPHVVWLRPKKLGGPLKINRFAGIRYRRPSNTKLDRTGTQDRTNAPRAGNSPFEFGLRANSSHPGCASPPMKGQQKGLPSHQPASPSRANRDGRRRACEIKQQRHHHRFAIRSLRVRGCVCVCLPPCELGSEAKAAGLGIGPTVSLINAVFGGGGAEGSLISTLFRPLISCHSGMQGQARARHHRQPVHFFYDDTN